MDSVSMVFSVLAECQHVIFTRGEAEREDRNGRATFFRWFHSIKYALRGIRLAPAAKMVSQRRM